jgi:hypothetical protein
MAELRQLLFEMRSHMSDVCAPFYLPHDLGEDPLLLLLQRLYSRLIVFELINV